MVATTLDLQLLSFSKWSPVEVQWQSSCWGLMGAGPPHPSRFWTLFISLLSVRTEGLSLRWVASDLNSVLCSFGSKQALIQPKNLDSRFKSD